MLSLRSGAVPIETQTFLSVRAAVPAAFAPSPINTRRLARGNIADPAVALPSKEMGGRVKPDAQTKNRTRARGSTDGRDFMDANVPGSLFQPLMNTDGH